MPIFSIFSRYVINFSVYTNCPFCFCGIVEIAVDLTQISSYYIMVFMENASVHLDILTAHDIGCQCALLIWLVSANLVKITSPYMRGISLQLTYSVYIQLITILPHLLQKYGIHEEAYQRYVYGLPATQKSWNVINEKHLLFWF